MGEKTAISWCDHTFNHVIGCTKVSPACTHCYAEAFAKRLGQQWGDGGPRVLTAPANWKLPLRWNRKAEADGVRRRVFCASMADIFEDWQGPIINRKGGVLLRTTDGYIAGTPADDPRKRVTMNDVRRDLFKLIDATPWLDWLLLTKRPENIRRMWIADPRRLGLHRPNVWLGCTVENQEYADQRIPELLKCRDLSPVLFVSCEPLLGPVDLSKWIDPLVERDAGVPIYRHAPDCPNYCDYACNGDRPNIADEPIWWVISGGESGPKARRTPPELFRGLRDQCAAAGVPYHHKQNGEYVLLDPDVPKSVRACLRPGEEAEVWEKVGKKAAGRLLDGVEHNGFPEVAHVH